MLTTKCFRMLVMQNSRTKATIVKLNNSPFERFDSEWYDFFERVSGKMRENKDSGAMLTAFYMIRLALK